jgi:GNAT superfamily N-acetyltransferase
MTTGGLYLRPARPEDRDGILALCDSIFPGTDHVPHYWASWLKTSTTLLAVIEREAQLAGFSVVDIRRGGGWLHSVRVSPLARNQGVGARFFRWAMAECRQRGLAVLRYATSPANGAMRHLGETHGFRRLGSYRYVAAPPLPDTDPSEVEELRGADLGALEGFLRDSAAWRAGHRTHCRAWVWDPIDRPLLASLLERRWVYAARSGGRITGVALTWQGVEDGYRWLFLSRLDCPAGADAAALGRFLRRRALRWSGGDDGDSPLCGMILDEPEAVEGLRRAGYEFDPEADLVVFEAALSGDPGHATR